MIRRLALLVVLLCLSISPAAGASEPGGHDTDTPSTSEPVSFQVSNPLVPGASYAVRGFLHRPSGAARCTSSVLLLLHGHSFGAFGWDFPVRPERYSVVRALAAAGYASVAIDELGYGSSDHPNGRTLTVQSYAAMTRQIIDQLRAGSYTAASPTRFGRVGLAAHSAGAEIAELTAGAFGGADLLVALGYLHFIKDEFGGEFMTQEIPRAAQSEYSFWGGTFEQAAKYHGVTDEFVEPEVIAEYRKRMNLTPSGQILSISNQPSRWVLPSIRVPIILVLAENDYIFPVERGEQEMTLFAGTADKTLHVVPDAGHSFFLEPSAVQTNALLVDWLRQHAAALPPC